MNFCFFFSFTLFTYILLTVKFAALCPPIVFIASRTDSFQKIMVDLCVLLSLLLMGHQYSESDHYLVALFYIYYMYSFLIVGAVSCLWTDASSFWADGAGI